MNTILINQKEISDVPKELKVPAYFKRKYGGYNVITKNELILIHKNGISVIDAENKELFDSNVSDSLRDDTQCNLSEIMPFYDSLSLRVKNVFDKLNPFKDNNRIPVLNWFEDIRFCLLDATLENGLQVSDINVGEFWNWCESNEWNVTDEPGFDIDKIKDLKIRDHYQKQDRFIKDWETFKQDKETFKDALECFLYTKFN